MIFSTIQNQPHFKCSRVDHGWSWAGYRRWCWSCGGHQDKFLFSPGTAHWLRARQPRALRALRALPVSVRDLDTMYDNRSVVRGLSVVSDVHQTIRPSAALILWSLTKIFFDWLRVLPPILGLSWTSSPWTIPTISGHTWQLSPTQFLPGLGHSDKADNHKCILLGVAVVQSSDWFDSRIACTCLQKWHYIYLLNYIPTPTALHLLPKVWQIDRKRRRGF